MILEWGEKRLFGQMPIVECIAALERVKSELEEVAIGNRTIDYVIAHIEGAVACYKIRKNAEIATGDADDPLDSALEG